MGNFALDLSKFANLTENEMEKTVIGSFIGLTTDITRDIPKDEGRAINSFFPAINKFSAELPTEDDLSGNKSIARATAEANKYKLGDTLTFTSNIDYIIPLEFGLYNSGPKIINGFSKKAPKGFLRVNLLRWQTYLDKQARKL